MEEIRAKIEEIKKISGIKSNHEISRRANISASTINDILGGKLVDPKYGTLKKIINGLGIDIGDLFRDYDEDKEKNYKIKKIIKCLKDFDVQKIDCIIEIIKNLK